MCVCFATCGWKDLNVLVAFYWASFTVKRESKMEPPKNNNGKQSDASRQESDGEQHLRVNFFFPGQVNYVFCGGDVNLSACLG